MLPKISQGVTTVVDRQLRHQPRAGDLRRRSAAADEPARLGSEAYEFPAFADYARALAETTPGVNVAALIGHSALRLATMSDIRVKATRRRDRRHARPCRRGDGERRRGLLDRAVLSDQRRRRRRRGGARRRALRRAWRRLRDAHARRDGAACSIRSPRRWTTAGRAKIPVVISHHKCAGPKNWGRTKETLPVDRGGRASSSRSALDAYPYAAGSTNLRADLVTDEYRIMITWSRPHPEMTGRDLADIAAEWGVDLARGGAAARSGGRDLFPDGRGGRAPRAALSRSTMIGSDGLPHDDHPHPRLWGTFPRVLGHYAREVGLFPLETADPQDDRPARADLPAEGPRPARAGLLRRPRRLRSRTPSSTARPTTSRSSSRPASTRSSSTAR